MSSSIDRNRCGWDYTLLCCDTPEYKHIGRRKALPHCKAIIGETLRVAEGSTPEVTIQIEKILIRIRLLAAEI